MPIGFSRVIIIFLIFISQTPCVLWGLLCGKGAAGWGRRAPSAGSRTPGRPVRPSPAGWGTPPAAPGTGSALLPHRLPRPHTGLSRPPACRDARPSRAQPLSRAGRWPRWAAPARAPPARHSPAWRSAAAAPGSRRGAEEGAGRARLLSAGPAQRPRGRGEPGSPAPAPAPGNRACPFPHTRAAAGRTTAPLGNLTRAEPRWPPSSPTPQLQPRRGFGFCNATRGLTGVSCREARAGQRGRRRLHREGFSTPRVLELVASVCTDTNWRQPWDAGVQTLFGLFFTLAKLLLVAFWEWRLLFRRIFLLKCGPTSHGCVSLPVLILKCRQSL